MLRKEFWNSDDRRNAHKPRLDTDHRGTDEFGDDGQPLLLCIRPGCHDAQCCAIADTTGIARRRRRCAAPVWEHGLEALERVGGRREANGVVCVDGLSADINGNDLVFEDTVVERLERSASAGSERNFVVHTLMALLCEISAYASCFSLGTL